MTAPTLVHFCPNKYFKNVEYRVSVNGVTISNVSEIKYLGFLIGFNLCNGLDIDRCCRSFLGQFNSLIRKFNKTDSTVFLHLFKSYCSSFYGIDQWHNYFKGCKKQFKHLKVAYHKSLKKIFHLRYYESNHDVCEKAGLLTFEHLVNSRTYSFIEKIIHKPNNFFFLIKSYLLTESTLVIGLQELFYQKYAINDLFENDPLAVKSRILFVDRHEPRSQYARNIQQATL